MMYKKYQLEPLEPRQLLTSVSDALIVESEAVELDSGDKNEIFQLLEQKGSEVFSLDKIKLRHLARSAIFGGSWTWICYKGSVFRNGEDPNLSACIGYGIISGMAGVAFQLTEGL